MLIMLYVRKLKHVSSQVLIMMDTMNKLGAGYY